MSSYAGRSSPDIETESTSSAVFIIDSSPIHQRRALKKKKKLPSPCNIKYHFRRPKGAGSYLILLVMILFFSYKETALYKLIKLAQPVLKSSLDRWHYVVVIVLLFETCPKLLYPFAGWLADAKFGRYRVLTAGVCITWISAVMLLFASVLEEYINYGKPPSYHHNHAGILAVVIVVYIFTAIGTAFFHANVIPFGIDQMEDCSSEEMSSFVHWYYWARNVDFGIVLELIVFGLPGLPSYCKNGRFKANSSEYYDSWVSLAQVFLLTLAVCLIFVFSKNLKTDVMIYNPITKVKVITKYVRAHRSPAGYRRAYTYLPEHVPSRFDFAKRSYGGIFEEDDVEEVVTFWRFMVFLIPIGIASTLFFTIQYLLEPLFHHMAEPMRRSCEHQYFLASVTPFMAFLVFIPIFEFIICPLFRKYIPQMRVKMGMGMLALVVAFCYLLALDTTGHIYTNKTITNSYANIINSSYELCFLYNQTDQYKNAAHLSFSPYSLVPLVVIYVIGELLVFLTVVEFICAQAPGSMRSFLISIYYFVYGISAILTSLLLMPFGFGFKQHLKHLPLSCGSVLFASVTAISIVVFIIYVIIARWYKNRQRGGQNDINYQSVVEGYYEKMIVEREQRQSSVFNETSYYNF